MTGLLIVVARDAPGIYKNLGDRYDGKRGVRIILDRRQSSRRQTPTSYAGDRRIADRRVQPDIEARLDSLGYAMISARSRDSRPR